MSKSNSVPTPEGLKEKAKIIRKFINEKCNVDVSHSHSLELISQLFGFKDWNTASATSKTEMNNISLPVEINTVGEMRKALESFDDSDIVDADYVFKLGDFLDSIDADMEDPEDSVRQEFRFVLEHLDIGGAKPRIANFTLNLENETLETDLYSGPVSEEPCDYSKNQEPDES